MEFSVEGAEQALRALKNRTAKEVDGLTGGLSRPSKMPGLSFNLPALITCNIGAKLAGVEGSVCSHCYACKGRYVFQNAKRAGQRRLARLTTMPHVWAAGMVKRIRDYRSGRGEFMRWHDSGDVLGPGHYAAIRWVAEKTPGTKHWLPTRERGTVTGAAPPLNLVPRLSTAMIGAPPPSSGWGWWSTVDSGAGFRCPASTQEGKCGDCRACWDKGVPLIDYPKH